jgi:hypothetical protein
MRFIRYLFYCLTFYVAIILISYQMNEVSFVSFAKMFIFYLMGGFVLMLIVSDLAEEK